MEVKEVSIEQEKIIHSEEPNPTIYTISNFITEEEANHFVEISKPKMKRSVVSDEKKGTVSKGRTGENCWLQHYTDEVTGRIANRIANLVGLPVENAESYQVVYYNTTQKYDQHYDAYHKNDTDKSKRCLRQGGQRVITALCYLNDVEEGGHTAFHNINIKVKPEKRKLVVFHNCYPGTTNVHINSLHAGTAPTKGEKYAFNLWFREQAVHKIYEYDPKDFLNTGPLPPAELKSQIENKIDNIVPPKPPVIEDNVIELNSSEKEMKINMISENPFIAEIENGLTGDECKTIRDACSNGKKQNQLRTSYWVNNKKDEIKPIVDKIASFMNVDSKHFENINVMQYPEGSCHGDHYDAFDLTTDKGKEYSQCRGQRIYTVIGFINNNKDKSGGNLRFIKFNKDITHEEGKLVIYKNMLDVSEVQFQRNDKMNYSIRPIKTGELQVFYMYLRVKDSSEVEIPLTNILQIDNKLRSINENPNVFENNISDQLTSSDIEKQLLAINAQLEILSKQPKQVKVQEIEKEKKMTDEEIEREKEKRENFHEALVKFYDKVVVDKENIKVDNRKVTPEGLFKFRRCVPEKDPALLEFFYTLRNSVPQKGILNYDNFKKNYVADEYNPCIVENVFEASAQAKIREYFHWAIDNKKYSLGDSQSNRFKAHNDFMTRILHYETLPLIEHLAKKELVPTYTYLSCYIRDCELPAHTDRADCEYTCSYIIDKPDGVNWDIYVDMNKEPLKSRGRYRQYVNDEHKHNCKKVDCGPGGLMMFNGIDHIHFREKLDGDFYYIILLHFRSKHSTYADTYK
jgi:prolyl 4-hydroxylase